MRIDTDRRLMTRTFAERIFLTLGRISARLPPVRGKTRLLLGLYRLLKLDRRRVIVRTRLRNPVPYVAELDLHGWLQRIAFLTGGYEADTVQFLLQLHEASPRRGYLLDVGANIGLLTVPFALSVTGNAPAAIAIEPIADNVAALNANIALNGLRSSVHVIPKGVGDEPGIVDIQVEGNLKSSEGTGTANILPAGSTYDRVRQTLTLETIDDLAHAGTLPAGCSVMKIDTDGYDLKVLQGAVAFLRRERPVIFGEFSAHCMNWHGQSVADVAAFAERHGYQVWRRVPRTWTFEPLTPAGAAQFSEDLLLVPAERAHEFGRWRGSDSVRS